MTAVQPIPEGYQRVTPYLVVNGASAAIDFYTNVLGATERMRMPAPGDKIGHAELEVGDSVVMLADEHPDMGARGPLSYGGSPVSLVVYVEDVDAIFEKATSLGATPVRPVQNQFYGDRSGTFDDPFGHRWTVCTHVEDVSPEQMAERMAALTDQAG